MPTSSNLRCSIFCETNSYTECSLFRFDGKNCHLYAYWQSGDFIVCRDCPDSISTVKVYFREKRCEVGWFPSFDQISCYKFGPTKLNRSSGQSYCRSLGASDLATIRFKEDNEKISREAKRFYGGGGYVLIKLNDIDKEGVFIWDEKNRGGIRLFTDGEPSNDNNNEHCVALSTFRKDDIRNWNDLPCKKIVFPLCETF